jgi:osomolarity two-component system, phosphorelay intermediate protein YPD1
MPSARPAPPPPPPPADDAPSSPKAAHHPPAPSSEAGPSPADAPADEKVILHAHVFRSLTPHHLQSTHPADPSDSADLAGIDMETFSQIRDLDEEDDYEFSKGMAWAYFDQAATTFEDMDQA